MIAPLSRGVAQYHAAAAFTGKQHFSRGWRCYSVDGLMARGGAARN